jgi:hypothetical protein
MKKFSSCIFISLLITAMLLTGCGASSSEAASDELTGEQTPVDGIQYGQVLSINEDEIVLALGTLDQKMPSGNGEGSDQAPPEQPTEGSIQSPSANSEHQGGNPGDGNGAPQEGGNNPGGEPPAEGSAPPDGATSSSAVTAPEHKSMIELTGDKLTITITDDTVITYMRVGEDTSDTTASLSDLAEGDKVAVTVGEDGQTALEITIMNFGTPSEFAKNEETESAE